MTKFRRTSLFAIAILWGLVAAAPFGGTEARAQEACVVRADAVAQLGKNFGEAVEARGLAENGKAMVEVFTSRNGSWTIVATNVNGRSCVVASGEAWTKARPVPGGLPSSVPGPFSHAK